MDPFILNYVPWSPWRHPGPAEEQKKFNEEHALWNTHVHVCTYNVLQVDYRLNHVLYTVEAQLQNEVFRTYVDVQRHQTCSEHVGWSVCVTHWLESSCVIRVKILDRIRRLAGWPVLDGRQWPTDTLFQIWCRLTTIKLWRCTTDARFSLHFPRQEEQRHG